VGRLNGGGIGPAYNAFKKSSTFDWDWVGIHVPFECENGNMELTDFFYILKIGWRKNVKNLITNQKGMSMIEVMVAVGIMAIIMAGVASMMSNQSKETKSLDEKMGLQGTQTMLSNILTSSGYCQCFMGTGTTVDTTQTPPTFSASLPTAIQTSYDASCNPIGTALLTVGTQLANTNLKPTAISLQNITDSGGATPGVNYTGNLVVNFDQTALVRARKDVSVPFAFSVNSADVSTARHITSCGSVVGIPTPAPAPAPVPPPTPPFAPSASTCAELSMSYSLATNTCVPVYQ
jgi:prepilin-type N-terminal cleavage/methylation domain-containing protein